MLTPLLTEVQERAPKGPRQDLLVLTSTTPPIDEPEKAAAEIGSPVAEEPTSRVKGSPAEQLRQVVRAILRETCSEAMTVQEVAEVLAITQAQAKQWLSTLSTENVLEKVGKSKPVRYRAHSNHGQLPLGMTGQDQTKN